MSILSTPGDVLQPIFALLDVVSLARLYLLGNRALYRKILVTRCVKSCYLAVPKSKNVLERPSWAICAAPLKRLSQLTPLAYYPCLESVYISLTAQEFSVDDVELLFQLKLRHLTLKATNSIALFWDSQKLRVRALDRLLPDLQTLEWEDTKPLDPRFTSNASLEFLGKHLPRLLVRLHLGIFSRFPDALIAHLPPNIFTLSISCCAVGEGSLGPFPRNVQELTLRHPQSMLPFRTSQLPPDLVSLLLTGFDDTLAIPGTITMLKLNPFEERLPKHLTSLRLPFDRFLEPEAIPLLPPTLLELVVPFSHRMSDEHVARLPQALTRLKLNGPNCSEISFGLLPQSLTSFTCSFGIQESNERSGASLAHLPPKLTKFDYRGSGPLTEPERFLSRSLRKLGYRALSPSYELLPEDLESLVIYHVHPITRDEIAKFPRRLRKLAFKGTNTSFMDPTAKEPSKANPELLNCQVPIDLPNTLTKLVVVQGRLLDDVSAANLPHHLTHLHLGDPLSARILPHLPKTLYYLFAPSIKIDSSVTQKLVQEWRSCRNDTLQDSASECTGDAPNSLDTDRISITTDDFFRVVRSMIPKNVATNPCMFYELNTSVELFSPLPLSVTSLDLSLTKKQISGKNVAWTYGIQDAKILSDRSCTFSSSLSPLFPRLERLTILPSAVSYTSSKSGILNMSLEDFQQLPTSLTHLEIGFDLVSSGSTHTLFPSLPYLSESTKMFTNSSAIEIATSAPSESPLASDPTCKTWLPRLSLLLHFECPNWNLPLVGLLPHLPPLVKVLRLPNSTLYNTEFGRLPKTLTDASFKGLHYSLEKVKSTATPISVAPFFDLPPSLTLLKLSGDDLELRGPCTSMLRVVHSGAKTTFSVSRNVSVRSSVTMSAAEDWQNFVEFQLSGKIPLSERPAEISNFDLTGFSTLTNAVFKCIPPTVTRVLLPDNHNITLASVGDWPPHLTSIQLGSLLFDKKDLVALPQDLVTFDDETVWSLIKEKVPKRCTDVRIERVGASNGNDFIEALPKSVQVLSLSANQRLFDGDMSKLPPKLQTIVLPENRRLTSQAVITMPRTITKIVLPMLPLTDDKVKHLPPGLVHLDVSQSGLLTEAAIKDFPRTLKHLDLSNTKVTDVCLPQLPRSLTYLKFKQVQLTASFLDRKTSIDADRKEEAETVRNTTLDDTNNAVDLFTLISSAQSILPDSLQCQPILVWEVEISSLWKRIPRHVTRISLPGDSIEMAQVLTKPVAGVIYRHATSSAHLFPTLLSSASSTPSLAPKTNLVPVIDPSGAHRIPRSQQTTAIERWYHYSLLDPSPPSYLLEHPEIPLHTLDVMWTIPVGQSDSLRDLPEGLKSFACHHFINLTDRTFSPRNGHSELPSTLTCLRLPHSKQLTSQIFPFLPPTLTDLELDLEDFQPRVDRLSDFLVPGIISQLPEGLRRLVLSTVEYVGDSTPHLALAVPKPVENEPM